MAKKSIKIRAKLKGDEVTVKALMTHPMESGFRKGKDGKPVPAHYITEVICESGGKNRMTAYWGGGVSKNPYISFKFKGGSKGEMLKLTWTDNQGKSDSEEVAID